MNGCQEQVYYMFVMFSPLKKRERNIFVKKTMKKIEKKEYLYDKKKD